MRGSLGSEAAKAEVAYPDSEKALSSRYVDATAKRARPSASANDANLPLASIGDVVVTETWNTPRKSTVNTKNTKSRIHKPRKCLMGVYTYRIYLYGDVNQEITTSLGVTSHKHFAFDTFFAEGAACPSLSSAERIFFPDSSRCSKTAQPVKEGAPRRKHVDERRAGDGHARRLEGYRPSLGRGPRTRR